MESTPCTQKIVKCGLDFQVDSLSGLYDGHPASKHTEKLEIGLVDWLCRPPNCFGGRDTAVFGSVARGDTMYRDFVCETFPTGEIACRNESDTVECPPEHNQSNEYSKLLWEHLPQEVARTSGDIGCYGSTCGCRTPRITVSKKLLPLTILAGADFVKAWLEIVQYHAYSWNNGLEHGDPSLQNVMYNDNLQCGVLSDFDVSICHDDLRIPGTDKTGMIPFMAMELLTDEYWRGEVTRVYRHELEAFIWILPFVFLGYQNKKFQPGALVEKWMTSDYNDCSQKKAHFLSPHILFKMEERCRDDFSKHWLLSKGLLIWLSSLHRDVFEQGPSFSGVFGSVEGVWPRFTVRLEEIATLPSSESKLIDYVPRLIAELELHNTLHLV